MFNAINTKLLIAILAVLTAIGSEVAYQRHQAAKVAAAAARAAAILQQQQREAEENKEHDETFRKRGEQDKDRHNSAAAHKNKTRRSVPKRREKGQGPPQLCGSSQRQDLEDVPALITFKQHRGERAAYGSRSRVSPGASQRQLRCRLALPIHEQSHESDDAER